MRKPPTFDLASLSTEQLRAELARRKAAELPDNPDRFLGLPDEGDLTPELEARIHARVAWIADGAPGNWSLAEKLAPHGTQILDRYHALEHAITPEQTGAINDLIRNRRAFAAPS